MHRRRGGDITKGTWWLSNAWGGLTVEGRQCERGKVASKRNYENVVGAKEANAKKRWQVRSEQGDQMARWGV